MDQSDATVENQINSNEGKSRSRIATKKPEWYAKGPSLAGTSAMRDVTVWGASRWVPGTRLLTQINVTTHNAHACQIVRGGRAKRR